MTELAPKSNEPMRSAPRLLVTATNQWPVVPRLVIALREMGSNVAVLCPTIEHSAEKLKSAGPFFHYNGTQPIDSLRAAIDSFRPKIIIPCCDRSVQHLHMLHEASRSTNDGSQTAALIERSIGAPRGFPITSSRFQLLEVAKSQGILVPETTPIRNRDDLLSLSRRSQPPWMIKADGTWGGAGVRLAPNLSEASRFLLDYGRRRRKRSLLKRLVVNRDRDWVVYDWKNSHSSFIAQAFVTGRPGNCAVFCWQGKVLAGIAVEVLQSKGATGPATVVQVVEGVEMMAAAEKIATHLKISGFFGLDFMIEEATGSVYLIEMNPRVTPPVPLPLGTAHDLLAAMWGQLTDRRPRDVRKVIENNRIEYSPEAFASNKQAGDRSGTIHRDFTDAERSLIQEVLEPRSRRSVIGKAIDATRDRKHRGSGGFECAQIRG
jgi:hypothetical protein